MTTKRWRTRRPRSLRLESLEQRELLHAGPVDPLITESRYLDVAEGEGAERVPDFQLVDVNATSSTADQSVSPRDYLGQVSGWYFVHAT